MGHRQTFFQSEATMGNSLHNKIYLGRRIDLHSRRAQALMCASALVAGSALLWLALRLLK
jgi:hypothetical protein